MLNIRRVMMKAEKSRKEQKRAEKNQNGSRKPATMSY
jgi:hypothetical protein